MKIRTKCRADGIGVHFTPEYSISYTVYTAYTVYTVYAFWENNTRSENISFASKHLSSRGEQYYILHEVAVRSVLHYVYSYQLWKISTFGCKENVLKLTTWKKRKCWQELFLNVLVSGEDFNTNLIHLIKCFLMFKSIVYMIERHLYFDWDLQRSIYRSEH